MKPDRRPGSAGVLAGRLAAAEEGRRRIARELHDDFGQRLAGLTLALKAARKQLPEGDPQRSELEAIGGSLAELAEDLRRLSHNLHPAALERRGLAEALRDHCAEIEQRPGPRVSLSLTGAEDSFPPDIALGLYRIAQESLANAVRHAGARTVHVTLRAAAGTARLTVADDGGGFDPSEARRGGGVGLASIEERAHLLGGRCRIASAPGAGTGIEVTVPLPADGALSQLRGLVRRHRGLVAAAALVILALAAGLTVTALQARRARQEAAWAAYYRGRTAESERLLKRALAICEKALPEDDLDLAGSREAGAPAPEARAAGGGGAAPGAPDGDLRESLRPRASVPRQDPPQPRPRPRGPRRGRRRPPAPGARRSHHRAGVGPRPAPARAGPRLARRFPLRVRPLCRSRAPLPPAPMPMRL